MFELECEAINVLREAFFNFKNPCLLFSGGKDSTVLLHLARKALAEKILNGYFALPILHIDTGHNFEETLRFRDQLASQFKLKLWVGYVEDSIRRGTVLDSNNWCPSRNASQSVTLNESISSLKIDCLIGGARRDEEKARAKERFFSVRSEGKGWQPENQRMEFGSLFNTRIQGEQEHMRVFPLNNWTERDIWNYIRKEKIELPSLYFSHFRKCILLEDGTLLAWSKYLKLRPDQQVLFKRVRFRTVGDMTCTGAIESEAKTLEDIYEEILKAKVSERGTRRDDLKSDSAMEDRKRAGYF